VRLASTELDEGALETASGNPIAITLMIASAFVCIRIRPMQAPRSGFPTNLLLGAI